MKLLNLYLCSIIALSSYGCAEIKPPFSQEQFLAAKEQCRAVDAYIIKGAPNAIGFYGSSDDHMRQAKCFKEKLAGTDVQTVVIGSRLYQTR
jgi:hypothetical protein